MATFSHKGRRNRVCGRADSSKVNGDHAIKTRMTNTGTKPIITAQKQNDDTTTKSRNVSRTAVCIRMLIGFPPVFFVSPRQSNTPGGLSLPPF
jgi:hypothetical protein